MPEASHHGAHVTVLRGELLGSVIDIVALPCSHSRVGGVEFFIEDLDDGTVRVTGELDLANADAFGRRLDLEDCPVRLDLEGVLFMDLAAVRVLLRHRDRCRRLGKELRIVAASSATRRVIELSDAHELFGAA
jgi:anti-anti-sigma factor